MNGLYYQPYIQRGLTFSRVELRHILLAVGVLTPAFGLLLAGGVNSPLLMQRLPFAMSVALVAVPTGFVLHEIGHKAIAQRYGCWAEFRANPSGLFIAIVTALLGFIFAAPGAVVISGAVNRQQNGRISLAGPAVNLVLALAFLALALALAPFRIAFLTGTVAGLFYNVFGVNALLAAFNLIPIPPLDGSKIWPWSVPVYLVALLLALALVASFLLRLGV